MTIREYVGNAKATALTGQLTVDATAINVLDGTGYPTGSVGPFVITISPGLAAEEKVLCIGRVGNTLNADPAGRGYDGTRASEHGNAAAVLHTYSATDAREANAHVNDTTGDPHPQYLTDAAAASAYLPRALADAKGDLLVATGPDTFARVPVGATTQVLTADSSDPTGLRWTVSENKGLLAVSPRFTFEHTTINETLTVAAAVLSVRVPTSGRVFIRHSGVITNNLSSPLSVTLKATLGTTEVKQQYLVNLPAVSGTWVNGVYLFSGLVPGTAAVIDASMYASGTSVNAIWEGHAEAWYAP
jgi:hypothetical protein